LKYLANKWGVEELGNRTANANSFGPLVTKLSARRTDTPEKVAPVEPPEALVDPGGPPPVEQLNEHQHALYLFSVYLES
jgi:hypothetical protein